MGIALVRRLSSLGVCSVLTYDILSTEIAVCPNDNEVQIYSKTADGWDLSETLTEVSHLRSVLFDQTLTLFTLARQTGNLNRLGSSYQPNCHLFS